MTTYGILCFIMKNGKTLLQKKSSDRFGGGKWNAPGGKVKPGETIEECAKREVEEETGLKIKKLDRRGILNFFWPNKKDPVWVVYVFSSENFDGRSTPGEEGKLKWFEFERMPFEEMWEDDKHWYPYLINKKNFMGNFYFTENFGQLTTFDIEEMRGR